MKLLALGIRVLYRLFCLFPVQNKVALMSRQGTRPFDYQLLEPVLRQRLGGLRIVWVCGREAGGRPLVGLTLRQLWHAATARLVVVDGYLPAVAIPPRPHRAPCVLVWHALGAIKKFGWAAVDTADGRTLAQAQAGCMHRGYDVVVAGLDVAVDGLAAGLDVGPSTVRVLGLPRIDYLCSDELARVRSKDAAAVRTALGLATPHDGQSCQEGAVGACDGRVVLYAPTLRRGGAGDVATEGVLAGAVAALDAALPPDCTLLVAGHPLTRREAFGQVSGRVLVLPPTALTIQALGVADCVVTDYSAVAYEAAIADVPVVFFCPDITQYRQSPGLNIDPLQAFPNAAFSDARGVAEALAAGADAGPALLGGLVPSGCRAAIADVCAACLGQAQGAE